jgi:hypothetical protein
MRGNEGSRAKNGHDIDEIWVTLQIRLVNAKVVAEGTPLQVLKTLRDNLSKKWRKERPSKAPSGSAALQGVQLEYNDVSKARSMMLEGLHTISRLVRLL